MSQLMANVKSYWEAGPCGTEDPRLKGLEVESKPWFEAIEDIRYRQEPMIFSAAQFTRHRGKKVLEIGVGAGSDHLQWARAGVDLYGVDLTEAAITTTKKRLSEYGLSSKLQTTNAERLPFDDGSFDVVYSWGVIHHSESPPAIVNEVFRVLRPGGLAITMFYSKHSVRTWKYWVKHALLKGKFHWGIKEVMWNHMESEGTRCYTPTELQEIFSAFKSVEIYKELTPYDLTWVPRFIHKIIPNVFGFFTVIRAIK